METKVPFSCIHSTSVGRYGTGKDGIKQDLSSHSGDKLGCEKKKKKARNEIRPSQTTK